MRGDRSQFVDFIKNNLCSLNQIKNQLFIDVQHPLIFATIPEIMAVSQDTPHFGVSPQGMWQTLKKIYRLSDRYPCQRRAANARA